MTYIIAQPCVDIKDGACVDVCPVDCIYTKDEDNMYYINPEECIDCNLCVPECPIEAICAEEDVPEDQLDYIKINAAVPKIPFKQPQQTQGTPPPTESRGNPWDED